jgi:ribosome-associated protein
VPAGAAGTRLPRRRGLSPARADGRPRAPPAPAVSDGLAIGHGVVIPREEITVRTSRSSGPGGQHANVTASRVEAVFDVRASRALSEGQRERILARCGPRVTAVAQDARSQARNRDLALGRLRARLARALAVRPPRRPTRPSAAATGRRLESKRRRGEVKRARRRPDHGAE